MTETTTYAFHVDGEQVRRFREAAWDTASPASTSIPPTMLGAAATLAGRPHSLTSMGFDVARAFHGTETVEMYREVDVGCDLTVRETQRPLGDVFGRRGGRMRRAQRVCEFLDPAGTVVARAVRVILETAEVRASGGPEGPRRFDDGLLLREDPVTASRVPLEELEPGPLPAATFISLTLTDFVRYAAASGDLTAIHFDEEAAASRGYRTPFAMGMLSAAFVGHCVEGWVELRPPWSLAIRFVDLTWPGDDLTVTGHVSRTQAKTVLEVSCAAGERAVTVATLRQLD
ncbi:MaoC/PaaZ C-terminal domain-containing protein [Micromonospora sp. NPDC005161]